MTQFEKIKQMSVEEMARMLVKRECCWHCSAGNYCDASFCDDCGMVAGTIKWLERKVENNE